MSRLKRNLTSSDWWATLVFGALLLFTIVFALIPLVMAVILSFDGRDYLGPFPPPSWSLRWYREFFSSTYYLDGLVTSLIVAVVATCGALAVGVSSAVFLDRYRFRGRDLLQAIFLSPLIVPTVVLGFAVLLYASALGIFEGMPRLIAGHLLITLPYVIRACLGSLAGIPPSLNEAAMSLGATPTQAFFRVTLPLAKTGVIAGAIFAFVMSFDEVAISLFLSDPFTYTLPVALLAEMRANLNLTVAAVSVIFMLFTLVLIWLLDRFIGLDQVVGRGVYRS